MRSKSTTVRLPWPLYQALMDVCHEDKFDSIHACIIGACIVLVQNSRRRAWVRQIANSNPRLQDFMLDKMLGFPTDLPGIVEALKSLKNPK